MELEQRAERESMQIRIGSVARRQLGDHLAPPQELPPQVRYRVHLHGQVDETERSFVAGTKPALFAESR